MINMLAIKMDLVNANMVWTRFCLCTIAASRPQGSALARGGSWGRKTRHNSDVGSQSAGFH